MSTFFNRNELFESSIMGYKHRIESMDDVFNNEDTFFNSKKEEKFNHPVVFRSEVTPID